MTSQKIGILNFYRHHFIHDEMYLKFSLERFLDECRNIDFFSIHILDIYIYYTDINGQRCKYHVISTPNTHSLYDYNEYQVHSYLPHLSDLKIRYVTLKFSYTESEHKNRKCFKCKNTIFFSDVLRSNIEYTRDRLIPIWESKNVEIVCCKCYSGIKEGIIDYVEEK